MVEPRALGDGPRGRARGREQRAYPPAAFVEFPSCHGGQRGYPVPGASALLHDHRPQRTRGDLVRSGRGPPNYGAKDAAYPVVSPPAFAIRCFTFGAPKVL